MSAQDGAADRPPLSASARARNWVDLEDQALCIIADLLSDVLLAVTRAQKDGGDPQSLAKDFGRRCEEIARTIVRGARVLADEDARARAADEFARAERIREAKIAAAKRRMTW